MKSVYKLYRDRLVEISGRSRSLYSRSVSKKYAYNLGKLLEYEPNEGEKFVDFLREAGKRKYRLLTDDQVFPYMKHMFRGAERAQHKKFIETEVKSLKQLKREVEEIEKETGRYELFVGYPFVEGMLGKDIPIKAPLLLFPARIHAETSTVELEILRGEPVMLNKVLILTYAKEFNLNIDELALELEHAAAEIRNIGFLKNYLNNFGIKLRYPAQKKAVYDIETVRENRDELEIRHFAVLGRYPLANSIYYDYNILEKKNLSSPAIDALLKNREIRIKDKKQQEGPYTLHELDRTQENAVIKVDQNANMVIYGPPGTGKSQTLANIISDSLCKNKRLLVVSQKRAALDVLYNRLGSINNKIMMLPDAEKNKNEFYVRARARHEQLMKYKPQFDKEEYGKISAAIEKETAELNAISEALFSKTAFGLSLQEMYAMSCNFGRNTLDYSIYQAMQSSDLLKLDYPELSEAVKAIANHNKGKLFYDHYLISRNNPLIDYIKTNLDMHQINKVRSFINKIITRDHVPFNIAQYEYSRYMLAHNLETRGEGDYKTLADMIARIQNPGLTKGLNVAKFPLFWPAYPFYLRKFSVKKQEILKKLNIAGAAVRHFVNEFELLSSVLEQEGLAMVIDNIAYGNDKFLKKLLAALEDYITVREITLALRDLSALEKKLLKFAFENTKNRDDFSESLTKILSIRIYHEVIKEEKQKEQELSRIIIFNDLRKQIMALKKRQRVLTANLANDAFNAEYKAFFEQSQQNSNNFLHQINKQQKLWPIRRLMEYFGEYLMRMYPCWLLSPEAVSTIMPLSPDIFDMILFDEASQIFIESAVPAIYRAKCVVVSGDNKQLRPTSAFVKRYMGYDDFNAPPDLNTQIVTEVESLLDLAASRLKAVNLTYHYRSRYEELINFSNAAFYNGNLQVAPNISKNRNYLPIERIKIEGKWIDRKNSEEAAAVVELVKKLLKTRRNNESLGIVTFNSEQEDLIKDLLDNECEKDGVFKSAYLAELNRKENGADMGIFVKNLENVQGDERDIIIFSVAYARNEEGKLNAQFGSLSTPGGENRLNVAVTRAKEKVYLITSVEPEEFVTVNDSKNSGPKMLKKYLQYARAVSNRDTKEAKMLLDSMIVNPMVKPKSIGAFENQLKAELEKAGYTVDAELGNADYKISLAVYDKELDRYILGLECDYAAQASSDSLLERDVYRDSFMRLRGWNIMRVWSRDWWLNRNAVVKSIITEAEASKTRLKEKKLSGQLKAAQNGKSGDGKAESFKNGALRPATPKKPAAAKAGTGAALKTASAKPKNFAE